MRPQPPQVASQDDAPPYHGTTMIERTCHHEPLLNMRETQEWIFTDISILQSRCPQHPANSDWLALLVCTADQTSALAEMVRRFELTDDLEQIKPGHQAQADRSD